MFNNMFEKVEEPRRTYCTSCADRIGEALAKHEGVRFEDNKKVWHERGWVALQETTKIMRDDDMAHDDDPREVT